MIRIFYHCLRGHFHFCFYTIEYYVSKKIMFALLITKCTDMKKLLMILLLMNGVLSSVFAQSFNGPESVEYDYLNQQWFVGNKNNGTVVIWKGGVLYNFASGLTAGPYGIEIFNGVLYCCHNNGQIRGFDINNGQTVFNITTSAQFLNGITHDDSALYATDFSGLKIFRIDVANQSYSIIASGLAKTPNGIFYDSTYNRCVFTTWGTGASIQQIDLSTNVVSTLKTTTLGNIDGIARDEFGSWYVSAWSNNTVTRFDSLFSGTGTVVAAGLKNPADIFYNIVGDTLAIPNSGSANNVVFVGFIANAVQESILTTTNCYYNTVSGRVFVSLTHPLAHSATITVYDVNAKIISQHVLCAGEVSLEIRVVDYTSGIYYFCINSEATMVSRSIYIYN